jgi:hypothetical protein
MKIVKLQNGNVQLLSDSGELIKSLSPAATLQIAQEGAAVRVNYGKNNIHDIYPSEVTSTEIQPAAAVPFTGDLQDLFNLLSESFFFDDVSGGGGGITSAANGLYLDGTTVKLGSGGVSPLIENTNIETGAFNLDINTAQLGTFSGVSARFADNFGFALTAGAGGTETTFFALNNQIKYGFKTPTTNAEIVGQNTRMQMSYSGPTGDSFVQLEDALAQISADTLEITIPSADAIGKVLTQTSLINGGVEFTNEPYQKSNQLGVEQITGTIITPPILTATANDYNPAGFAGANMIRQEVNTNNRIISGFVAPPVGENRIIYLNNISATQDIRIVNNSALSTAANRILLGDNQQKSLTPNETLALWYDHISQRWRVYNKVG